MDGAISRLNLFSFLCPAMPVYPQGILRIRRLQSCSCSFLPFGSRSMAVIISPFTIRGLV